MLPLELLSVKIGKNWIKPNFAYFSDYNLSLARDLIEAFSSNIGNKKGLILEKVRDLELLYLNYKLVRGLVHILERRCVFERESTLEPIEARKRVFGKGVLTIEERERVIEDKARELGIEKGELENLLWSDLEEEKVLKSFFHITPEDLIKSYNLSLTQTLLFHSIRTKFTVSSNWKEIMRRIKHLGLMYEINYEDNNIPYCYVDGPLSIFEMNERYGASMAKLLPLIFESKSWFLSSEVVRKMLDGSKRVLKFELDSNEVKEIIKASDEVKEKSRYNIFDSTLEEDFYRAFKGLNTGWVLKREPEPLITERGVLIPDFSFEKENVKVYFEIIGFWTQDYIKRKVEKIRSLKLEEKILLAIDEELSCSEFKDFKVDGVIIFKRKIPLNPILKYLKLIEEDRIKSEISKYKEKLRIEGDVVRLEDLAEREGISLESIKRILKDKLKDYVIIGNDLVSLRRMEEIKKIDFNNMSLSEAYSLIRDVREVDNLLRYLGYSVRWKDITEGIISKE
ncbi:MAG: DUF790 family protein [Nitrososphaerales archaeon]